MEIKQAFESVRDISRDIAAAGKVVVAAIVTRSLDRTDDFLCKLNDLGDADEADK